MSIRPPKLSQVRIQKLDKVPDGWFTRAQLEKAWDLSQAHTALLIKGAVEGGKAEVRMFRIGHTIRAYQSTPHYRFK